MNTLFVQFLNIFVWAMSDDDRRSLRKTGWKNWSTKNIPEPTVIPATIEGDGPLYSKNSS